MRHLRSMIIFILALGVWTDARAVELIPRDVLFGKVEREFPLLAPDGARLAWLAPDAKGVNQVWVGALDGTGARAVTRDPHRDVILYWWAGDSRRILYMQDSDGDENWHLYSGDIDSSLVRDLTPFLGARAQNLISDPRHPGHVLVGLNLRDRDAFDMYRIDLETGAVVFDTPNPGDVLSWSTDGEFVIRAATAFNPKTLETIVRVRDSASSPWRDLLRMPFEDSTMFGQVNGGSVIAAVATDGKTLDIVTALHSKYQRLERIDAKTGATLAVLAEDPASDVADDPFAEPDFRPLVLTNPATGDVQAVGFEPDTCRWTFVDKTLAEDFSWIQSGRSGFFTPISRTRDDRTWILKQTLGDMPNAYYLYRRGERSLQMLFQDFPQLANSTLARTDFVSYTARDGLKIPAYLALPPGLPAKGLPFVVLPHGGPWWRDRWGFDSVVQFLANRGYAVLMPQFRGSIGFGKAFLNAGNHEFGLKMLTDIIDGVHWAVARGIADPKRLAIMGYSAGGYATLRAITTEPDLFRCAVDVVGPSELKLLFTTMPAGWGAVKARWVRRMGDVEHDEELNRALSPLYHADSIRAPLMVVQGANDPRVNIRNSDMIVAAARKHGVPVTYVVYTDEGHDFVRPENNLDFYGRVEEFLSKYLGGRAEPWRAIEGARVEVR